MPTSNHNQIPRIIDILLAVRPKRILDVGIGFGKYGFLSREYLEVWGHEGEYRKDRIAVDGVEYYEKYITNIQRSIYDKIYTGDIEEVMDQLERYDLTFLVDVIEHFDLPKGKVLIEKLLSKSEFLLIATPRFPHRQEATFGNVKESHLSRWAVRNFKLPGTHQISIKDGEGLIVLLSRSVEKIGKIRKNFRNLRVKNCLKSLWLVNTVYKFLIRKKFV